MMRKIVTSLLLLFSISFSYAEVYSGNCGSKLTWILDTESGVLTISGSGAMTSSPWRYQHALDVKSVNLPYGLTEISESAFKGCANLPQISIPNSVKVIGVNAFYECTGLTNITIPNSVDYIKTNAFYKCTGLTSVILPSNLQTISYSVFEQCTALTNITIPNTVTIIQEKAFSGCKSLTSITIPSSVTRLMGSAFGTCTGLQYVNVTSLKAWCDIIMDNWSSSPLYYAKHLRLNGIEITDLVIPNTVTTIRPLTFCNCQGLKSITVPKSVSLISNYAFSDCIGLSTIILEATTPPTLSSSAFDGVADTIPVIVPCGFSSVYLAASGWSSFSNIVDDACQKYTLSVVSANFQQGTVTGAGEYAAGSSVSISAIAKYGYRFLQWNDGNMENPRTVVVDSDTSFVAQFTPIKFNVDATIYPVNAGSVSGERMVDYQTSSTFEAIANSGFAFAQWSDGILDNPRTVTITSDTVLRAEFIRSEKEFIYLTDTIEMVSASSNNVIAGNAYVAVYAVAQKAYEFISWSDGVLDNPRIVDTSDGQPKEYVAIFESSTGLNSTSQQKTPVKHIHQGIVYIVNADNTYTVLGAKVNR